MLNSEKLKALADLVGPERARALVLEMSSTEKSAQEQGTKYKSFGDDVTDMVADLLKDAEEATTEKCTPGTKDGKYGKSAKAEDDMEEDDMPEDDSGEEEDDMEMLLSEREMKMIAGYVAKAMSSEMKNLKMMMRQKDSSGTVDALKDYTETHNEFAEKMVSVLEEINTRVKAVEAHIGTGHVPSESLRNAIGLKSDKIPNLSPQDQSAYNFWFSEK
jgi:hypothetical protein